MRRAVIGAAVGLLAAGGTGLGLIATSGRSGPARVVSAGATTIAAEPTTTVTTTPPTTAANTTTSSTLRRRTTTTSNAPAAIVKATLAGCPPPPQPPAPPPPPPWHPAVLVPASSLPPLAAARPWHSDLSAIAGKGMWIWEWAQTDGGDPQAIVHQAAVAGLHQLWLRVGDSMQGFYGAPMLDALVPVAHAHGIKVIAWGFPYLYDPLGDAGWTAQVLAWKAADGQRVDGFSADIERPTEGVALNAQRAGVYLQAVRRAAGSRLVVATVYPPLDTYWNSYPYSTMARYVDAFAPMIYWECTDPGSDAAADVARLSKLRPVTIIGQAYNMAAERGRPASPSAAELNEFMASGQRAGAVGASFWVWQTADAEEWGALAAYPWPGPS